MGGDWFRGGVGKCQSNFKDCLLQSTIKKTKKTNELAEPKNHLDNLCEFFEGITIF